LVLLLKILISAALPFTITSQITDVIVNVNFSSPIVVPSGKHWVSAYFVYSGTDSFIIPAWAWLTRDKNSFTPVGELWRRQDVNNIVGYLVLSY
jgi:hypothetical protein